MAIVDDYRSYDQDDADYPAFKNNFIDIPWDDRSRNSKIAIISLLVAIVAVTAFCVCGSFVMHYGHLRSSNYTVDNTCPFINVNEKEHYNFVAMLYSVSSNKQLCVGAVISDTTVLADNICAKIMPVILFVGTSTEPRCKKGFPVDAEEMVEIDHEGILSKKLILLESKNSFAKCGTAIPIGSEIHLNSPAYIIGRPLALRSRGLIKQPVTVSGRGNCSLPEALSQKLDRNEIICVRDVGKCQVRAGDLLVQGGRLYGLASTGVPSSATEAFFADLTIEYRNVSSKLRGKLKYT